MQCQCEFCKKVFNVDDKHAGKNTNCPNCGKSITIQEYIELKDLNTPPPKKNNNKSSASTAKYILGLICGFAVIFICSKFGLPFYVYIVIVGIIALCFNTLFKN